MPPAPGCRPLPRSRSRPVRRHWPRRTVSARFGHEAAGRGGPGRSAFAFPIAEQALVAEELKRRFHADLIRFSNSGTEATMDAIRVARGFTGREKILKFEGGYHGHHDDVLVSIQPPRDQMGDASAPN